MLTIVKMAQDTCGTRRLQHMLEGGLTDHSGQILTEVTQNLTALMFNRNSIWVARSCFKLLLSASRTLGTSMPEIGQRFTRAACDGVFKHWEELVRGRTSQFSYRMVMWTMEFLYMQKMEGELQKICRNALNFEQQLVSSNYGHHVLQHAVLLTQKALVRSTCSLEKETWGTLRQGFYDATVQALCNKDGWDKQTNPASHFINKCLELLASDPKHKDEALTAHWAQIMRTVRDDDCILGLVAAHSSGQFTARRIYELGSSQERRMMEWQAPTIHRPELRSSEKFNASLIPTEQAFPFL
jgi:hypothetical protein